MRLAFLFLFFSAIFFSSELVAQRDSTVTDTVVIMKDPHVIRHEVVIRSPSEPEKKVYPMKFGLYYGMGSNKIKSNTALVEVKGNSFQNFGIQFGSYFRKFEFSTGVGILSTAIDYNKQKSFETVKYQKETIVISQNTITITDENGVVTTITTTKYGEITREIREVNNYRVSNSYKRTFLQVPVNVGYTFILPYNKLKIIPGFHLIINKYLHSSEAGEFNPKSIFIFYGCHLKLEYNINDYISAELKGFWQQCQGNIYKEKHTEVWKLTGINFGINYLIGNY